MNGYYVISDKTQTFFRGLINIKRNDDFILNVKSNFNGRFLTFYNFSSASFLTFGFVCIFPTSNWPKKIEMTNSTMATALHPLVQWAQRDKLLYLTIEIDNVSDLQITDNSLHVKYVFYLFFLK